MVKVGTPPCPPMGAITTYQALDQLIGNQHLYLVHYLDTSDNPTITSHDAKYRDGDRMRGTILHSNSAAIHLSVGTTTPIDLNYFSLEDSRKRTEQYIFSNYWFAYAYALQLKKHLMEKEKV